MNRLVKPILQFGSDYEVVSPKLRASRTIKVSICIMDGENHDLQKILGGTLEN